MTQFPQINLNGTDGGDLADEYMRAINAVTDAIQTVQAVTVHGRDYQTLGPEAYPAAHLEHVSRLARLLTVRDELTAIALNIAEQNDARFTRKARS